jgi:7,8-dihydropterin-6-yl-methyl-4-(beta-D-ribofuranosyl)aminobenzene 5'-phosphate synthase
MNLNSALHASLAQTDRVEITTIVDNYTHELLGSSEPHNDHITRAKTNERQSNGKAQARMPLAEHGLSLLIRLFSGNQKHTVLFDGSYSKATMRHNLKALNIDLSELEVIVLSHGHRDHFGGLYEVAKCTPNSGLPLIAHPDAFLDHYHKQADGTLVQRIRPIEQVFEALGLHVKKCREPQLLASNLLLTTGEVERSTDFEVISPGRFIERDGQLEPDLIMDDQALIINLRDKGLVVISGCAHSGIINTVVHAMKITRTNRVYAVLGGFHLAGPRVDILTEETIKALLEINPQVIVPMHCSSWKSIVKIQQAMPDAFVLNSVGTKLTLG